jgi:predicted flavoprotein YhiN
MNYDLAIIGGGAAGMAAAVFASENGVRTVVIEHNRQLGKKLAITGKGRCNVTNNSDNDNIMRNIPVFYTALLRVFRRMIQ